MSASSKAASSVPANPTQALNNQFQVAQKAASDFEQAQVRHGVEHDTKLANALVKLYEFGENLMGTPNNYQEAETLKFLASHNVKVNLPKRRNPYIALVEMAFSSSSPSLRSQRAKVLEYARHSCLSPASLQQDISTTGGIKKLHKEAVGFFGGTAKENNDAAKLARLARARDHLNKVPSLADFQIADVPDGFAVMLVRVEAGNASVVNVLQDENRDSARLDATLTAFDPQGPARRQLLATLPLGRLWRAIDLVMSMTNHIGSNVRHVGIRNLTVNGVTVNELMSLSPARHETIVRVRLSEQFVALPDDKWHIIYSGDQADADLFHTSFESYTGWHVDGTALAAALLLSPIQIQALPDIPRFRVEVDAPTTGKSVTFTIAGYRDLLTFVDGQAAGHKAKPGQAQVTPLPELMSMELAGSEFRLSMNGAAHYTKGNPYAAVGTGNHEPEPFTRELARANVTAIARTLLDYEVEAQGSFIDTEDLIDACLRLEADLDGDLVTITIPTREEEVRNSFTVELEAA